jgi:hypothetical protein
VIAKNTILPASIGIFDVGSGFPRNRGRNTISDGSTDKPGNEVIDGKGDE